MEMLSAMGRRRKNVIKGDFEPLDLERVGMVTMGTKPYFVEQHDDKWPPYAEIISSRYIDPTPKPLGRRGAHKPEFLSDKFPQMRTHKWCAGECGDWKLKADFSPKADAADKLHPYCKACRARHARKIYWAAKETAQKAA